MKWKREGRRRWETEGRESGEEREGGGKSKKRE